jgi:hypothetical protein
MTTARRRFAVLAVMGAVISGCGASASGPPPPRPSPSSTPGAAFDAGPFATVIPTGWQNTLDNPSEVAKLSTDGRVVYLVEQAPPGVAQANVNDVRANVNVVSLTTAVPDDQVATYLASVTDSGATNLSSPQQFTIDGATGQYITYDRDIQGTPGESRDMVVNHRGVTYHVVLNTSQFAFVQQLPGLQAVLAAWRWSPA